MVVKNINYSIQNLKYLSINDIDKISGSLSISSESKQVKLVNSSFFDIEQNTSLLNSYNKSNNNSQLVSNFKLLKVKNLTYVPSHYYFGFSFGTKNEFESFLYKFSILKNKAIWFKNLEPISINLVKNQATSYLLLRQQFQDIILNTSNSRSQLIKKLKYYNLTEQLSYLNTSDKLLSSKSDNINVKNLSKNKKNIYLNILISKDIFKLLAFDLFLLNTDGESYKNIMRHFIYLIIFNGLIQKYPYYYSNNIKKLKRHLMLYKKRNIFISFINNINVRVLKLISNKISNNQDSLKLRLGKVNHLQESIIKNCNQQSKVLNTVLVNQYNLLNQSDRKNSVQTELQVIIDQLDTKEKIENNLSNRYTHSTNGMKSINALNNSRDSICTFNNNVSTNIVSILNNNIQLITNIYNKGQYLLSNLNNYLNYINNYKSNLLIEPSFINLKLYYLTSINNYKRHILNTYNTKPSRFKYLTNETLLLSQRNNTNVDGSNSNLNILTYYYKNKYLTFKQ